MITQHKIKDINSDRLSKWEEDLTRDSATAMVTIGVGHGSNAGQLHVYIPEGLPQDQIKKLVQAVANQL